MAVVCGVLALAEPTRVLAELTPRIDWTHVKTIDLTEGDATLTVVVPETRRFTLRLLTQRGPALPASYEVRIDSKRLRVVEETPELGLCVLEAPRNPDATGPLECGVTAPGYLGARFTVDPEQLATDEAIDVLQLEAPDRPERVASRHGIRPLADHRGDGEEEREQRREKSDHRERQPPCSRSRRSRNRERARRRWVRTVSRGRPSRSAICFGERSS